MIFIEIFVTGVCMKSIKLLFLLCFSFPLYADTSLDFLKELTAISAVSGYEKPVRDAIKNKWQSYFSTIKVDGIGNVIAQNESKSTFKVLLMAHMDEIGFMVESITPEGYLTLIPIGGLSDAIIYAHRWEINSNHGKLYGYSGMDSPHLLTEPEKLKLPSTNSIFLDMGAQSAQQAKEMGARVGAAVTPSIQWTQLGPQRFLTKALDDRAGLAIITDVASRTAHANSQLVAAATVQEEIGLRGASVVYTNTKPDVVINIEVGIADDYPHLISKRKGRISLGKGPTLFVYDKSMIPHQELLAWIDKLAEQHHIPIQYEVETGYGQDGAKLQMSGEGAPVINIGLPIRYAHQEGGVFDKEDYDNTVKLVELIVNHLNQEEVKQIIKG